MVLHLQKKDLARNLFLIEYRGTLLSDENIVSTCLVYIL